MAQSMSLESRRGPPSSDIVFTRLWGPVIHVMVSKDATRLFGVLKVTKCPGCPLFALKIELPTVSYKSFHYNTIISYI